MKRALLFITLASWSTGQIVFPDTYDSMIAKTVKPQRFQSSPQIVENNILNDNRAAVSAFSSPQAPTSALISGQNDQLPAVWSRRANSVISKGVARFALRVDGAVSATQARGIPAGNNENVIFSPLSVAAALALVLLGSAGKTFEEVSTLLGFNAGVDISRNSEIVHQMFGVLLDAVSGTPGIPAPQSYFASGIFVRDGYPIRREFQAVSRDVYKSEVINLDFEKNGRDAQEKVNSWVSQKTRGKISEILREPPSPETKVIIASALYFNGEWNQFFIDGATKRKPFTVASGEVVDVDMMFNGGEFPFFEDKELQAKIVGLPYKGKEVTMYVVLPTNRGVNALRDLESRLSAERLENLIGSTKNETCIIALPRMKLSSTLSLSRALQSLGLNSLFDPLSADLSLLSPGYTRASSQLQNNNQFANPSKTQAGVGLNDKISFPNRFGEDEETAKPLPSPLRRNFFSYDDRVGGYHVQQWATGFSISRINRQRRRRSFRVALRKSAAHSNRARRQVRPIDQDFLNYVSQNRPSYGLDNLRNNLELTNPGLFAEDVIHRVEIDITEKGTEAAAVTAVTLTRDGSQKRLVADRPFLFFIRHESTGLLLFWGTVNKPTPNYPSEKRTT
ncbi:serine protease inhibitor 28Dc-like [Neodiprion fabricii]|uniref:serine protease inhibitor 28Dc-like n=1 Tax=Neodiprion fabricii TaxID=2872261 RepID=UPI001ED95FFA|nr:serine protease inhibitor 28Dc-like [Neodiprion fabricii]